MNAFWAKVAKVALKVALYAAGNKQKLRTVLEVIEDVKDVVK